MVRGERIGAGRIAVPQQAAGEQVALGPERRQLLPRRVALRSRSGALPQRQGIRRTVQMAQPPGMIQDHARIGVPAGGKRGEQRIGAGRIALQGEPRLGRCPMRGIEARDLAGRRCRVVPGKVLKTLPLILGSYGAGPAAQEGGLCPRIGDPGEPGVAGLFGGLGIVAAIRLRLGATQHGLRQGQLVAPALRQHRRLVGFGGDRLLATALQQRLVRPVGILRHEVGDLVRRCRAGCQKPEITDQLDRHRVGIGRCGELGVRPPVGADRRARVGRLRRHGVCPGEQREESVTRANRGVHVPFLAQGGLAMHLSRA